MTYKAIERSYAAEINSTLYYCTRLTGSAKSKLCSTWTLGMNQEGMQRAHSKPGYIRNAVHQQYFICLLSFSMRLHLGFQHEMGACTCT